jgi:hypothetical protein
MLPPGDKSYFLTGLRQPPAEVSADAARADYCNPHFDLLFDYILFRPNVFTRQDGAAGFAKRSSQGERK